MSDEPIVTLYSSEPLHGMGEIKRVNGRGIYPGGEIEFDGMIDGEMTIKIRCSFADGQRIAEAVGKILTP